MSYTDLCAAVGQRWLYLAGYSNAGDERLDSLLDLVQAGAKPRDLWVILEPDPICPGPALARMLETQARMAEQDPDYGIALHSFANELNIILGDVVAWTETGAGWLARQRYYSRDIEGRGPTRRQALLALLQARTDAFDAWWETHKAAKDWRASP